MSVTVAGKLITGDGIALTDTTIRFKADANSNIGTAEIINRTTFTTVTDASGNYSVSVQNGAYIISVLFGTTEITLGGCVINAETPSPIDLLELTEAEGVNQSTAQAILDQAIAAKNAAISAQDDAEDARDLAQGYRDEAAIIVGTAAYPYKPSVNPILDLDFANQEYSEYEVPTGKTSKPLADVLDVTRGSDASYTDPTGMTRTTSANTARLTYDAETGVSEGLLVEESRTNLVGRGNYLIHYGGSGVIGSTSEEAPDGTLSASYLSSGTEKYQTVNLSGVTTACFSWYAKKRTTHSLTCVEIYESVGTPATVNLGRCSFNLDSEIFLLTPTGTQSSGFEKLINGWYRIWVVVSANFTSSARFDYQGYLSENADSLDNLFWNPQLEQGSFPTSLIPDATIFNSRASTGTYYDSTGTLQTAATDEARYSYNPANLKAEPVLLLEEATENLLSNRAVMVTETVTVVNGETYTLSFEGDGSVQLSGADSTNVLGTGLYPNEARHTFVASSNSLTLTVTGNCALGQLENKAYRTSWCDGTRAADLSTGVQATRAADSIVRDLSTLDGWNGREFTIYSEFWHDDDLVESNYYYPALSDSSTSRTTGNRLSLRRANNGTGGIVLQIVVDDTVLVSQNVTSLTDKAWNKVAITLSSTSCKTIVNGVVTNHGNINYTGADFKYDWLSSDDVLSIREHKLYPKALSQAEAIALTS
jgi:hypothetical protein